MMLGLGAAAVVIGGAAHGAFHRNSPIFGPAIRRLPTHDRAVALTFDDGPNPPRRRSCSTPSPSAASKRPSSFSAATPSAGRIWSPRAAAEGHALGNHGYYHRKLHLRSPAYVRRDLELGTDAMVTAGASHAALLPRSARLPQPVGDARSRATLGQRTVGWSLGVWDSDRPGVDEIARRTVEGASPGSILLLHDGDGYDPDGDRLQTAHAVPLLVDRLLDRGYRFSLLDAA